MKKVPAALLVMGLVGSTNIFANSVCSGLFGIMNCGKGTVSTVDFTGIVNVDGTIVTNAFDVLGNVEMKNANITNMHVRGMNQINNTEINGYMDITGDVHGDHLKINGSASIVGNWYGKNAVFNASTKITGITNCENCTFNNFATLTGSINVSNSQFFSSISINATESEFKQTKLQDILVKKPSNNNNQTITLSQNTTVKNITFENQNGTVVVIGSSKIMGRVEGGRIINR